VSSCTAASVAANGSAPTIAISDRAQPREVMLSAMIGVIRISPTATATTRSSIGSTRHNGTTRIRVTSRQREMPKPKASPAAAPISAPTRT
jgi:hypothetical protein